jgi:hypothetical protein
LILSIIFIINANPCTIYSQPDETLIFLSRKAPVVLSFV